MTKDFMPRLVNPEFYVNLDCFSYEFRNEADEHIKLLSSDSGHHQSIRTAWKIVTVDMMHEWSEMKFSLVGKDYVMYWCGGFMTMSLGKHKNYHKIWARPITPYHLKFCMRKMKGMGEAVKHVKMNEETYKKWTQGKRYDKRGIPVCR